MLVGVGAGVWTSVHQASVRWGEGVPSSSGNQADGNLKGECQATDLAPLSPDRELQDTLGLQCSLWDGYLGSGRQVLGESPEVYGEAGQNWQVACYPEFSGS